MTTETLQYTGQLTIAVCWCGIRHAMPRELYDEAHRQRKETSCPLGHSGIYGDTETDRLKRDLTWTKDQLAAARARADQTEASLRATKGHVTRLRSKVIAGACPFCGQHLRDLERHITRQHKDETPEGATE